MQDHASRPSLDNTIALQKFGVGQPVRRKEDDTLVRGKGKYTDDFNLPGQAYAFIVRSSYPHGIIRGIDTSAAKAMPGVLGVWTGTDLTAANYSPFTCGLPLKNRDGSPLHQTNRMALMTDKVRYVGDPVAFVVAETLAQARDAAEAVALDIEELPVVVNVDLPIVAEDYVHRTGRTGRAGASGEAVSLVCADEVQQLAAIEALTKQTLQRKEEAGFEPEHRVPETNAAGQVVKKPKKPKKPKGAVRDAPVVQEDVRFRR